ncbi:putative phosphatidylinositol-4-phosphate 5-kinase [Triangularia verruculosa]|uniref:1-phosphatidylinositol-3-phosphate 5-kinase n=1 Tax=Triangularia verruculosa TaxID=2587418 RepID=A0AAN6XLC3_9PEZI|nr:putative phosphatidylinositol-4-phosphate 5-kinase [Triangularia verruculosa]
MASQNGLQPPSLAPPVPASPADTRSRHGSIVSPTASTYAEREQLSLALDKIHTTASQSDVLITFNDFAPPPGSLPTSDKQVTAGEIVQQGLSGFYSRIKEAVSGVGKSSAHEVDDADSYDGASRRSLNTVNDMPRGDSGATSTTLNSTVSSDAAVSGMSSSGLATTTTDSLSPAIQSSKASSITTASISKNPSPGASNIPKIAVAATTTNTPAIPVVSTGFAESDTIRGTANREELPSRNSGRGSISRLSEVGNSPLLTGNGSLDSVATNDRIPTPSRARRDDVSSLDGNPDAPRSPIKATAETRPSSVNRASPAEMMRRPAVIDRITFTKGGSHSRSSSMEPGTAEASPISTSAHSSVYHDSFHHNERPQRLQSGIMRIPGTTANEGAPEMVNARLERMRKQVLSKEFWMADETCKECFLCGTPFSAFRRKHHCRTCGCIFDSKCTSNISGAKFGVQGSLRVCKTCLNVINRRYDSGSDDSADESYLPAIFRANQSKPAATALKQKADDEASIMERTEQADHTRSATTPMMAIPATRRVGDSNRNSAILEIDMPQLSRPSSSRSLKSLSTSRPQSSGHRRHHSKHSFLTRLKGAPDERAPFRKPAGDDPGTKSNANAFHADNIIDPELADYMSDESSEDEQQMGSIFATMNSSDFQPASLDPDRSSFGTYLGAGRKHRFRHGEKSTSGLSYTSRGFEEGFGGGGGSSGGGLQNLSIHARPPRRRNMSIASISAHHLRSPRPKSAIIKGNSASTDALSIFESGIENSGSKRNDATRDGKLPEEGLNPVCLQHVKRLFRQLLDDAEIPNPTNWERALIPILDKCADDVDPDIRNGDDMDIRHWVKLKKIPGGRPSDTAYVHGVVFTKNLALKSMPRKIRNPRIVVITFPLEYQRHPEQHFMSLQPVIEQEKEYLRMVVNRILNLEPHVLLVEKSVAGVALQYLSEANVAVAYNVKPTVIEAVSRIVNMPVISSMDMLSLGARVGTCENFEVKTYVNHGIKGKKKTYIFLSGCPKDRGCTIALRGASTQILARMKRITEFMVYVVYNLKLESCLMRDEFVQIPTEIESGMPSTLTSRPTDDSLLIPAGCAPDPKSQRPAILITSQSTEDENLLQQAQANEAPAAEQEPAANTTNTAPGTQPPADVAQKLISLHESHSHVQVPEDVPMPTFYSDMVAKYETRILSASPFVKFTQPYLLMRAREQERRLVYLRRLRDQDIVEDPEESEKPRPLRFQLIKPEMVHEIGQKAPRKVMEVLHAVHDVEYDKALHNYQTQSRQWETYIQDSLDLFDPYSHQNIVVLYSVTCTETKIPCVEPGLIAIEFYNEHPDTNGNMDQDCTLGQYIEDICEGSDMVCHANGCDRKMLDHHRTYVHDNARITIILENSPAWPENFPEKPQEAESDKDGTGICMWNYCKECKKHFGLMPMSVSTWKYSFGKYLELSFWSRCVRSSLQNECPHDHQKDHIRFFYYLYRDIAVRVHYDPIDLFEIIVPRPRIMWKVDHDLRLKNDVFTKAEERWIRFMTSVRARLKSIRIDSVLPEKAEACTAEIERLTKKAHDDQAELVRSLQETYMSSKYYEVIPFNAVIRGMLEKVTDWDAAFTKFEADFLSDKDVRQLTIIQLKKMFTDNESKESLPSTDGTTSVGSESEEKSTPSASQPSNSEFEEKPSQNTEGENSQPPETPVSPTSKPIAVTEEAASSQADELLERVEPLDLATPTSPSLAKSILANSDLNLDITKQSPSPPSEQLQSAVSDPNATMPPPATPVAPLAVPFQPANSEHMSLTEKVEQLRREQRAVSTDATGTGFIAEGVSDSTRTAGDRAVPRKTGQAVSPPMIRALSQPVGTLPRTQSAIGKLLKEQKAQEAASEAQKTTPDKGEKKFTDRIGLGALKNRKAPPSAIPRYVHKRESKVSTLARHFEQLSREFEKERMRDRKQRAAKMQSTRAFLPRTSTKTIVEVYKDVDQAVKEPGPDEEQHLEKPQHDAKSGETSQPVPGTTPDDSQNKASEPSSPLAPPSKATGTHTEGDMDDSRHEGRGDSDDEGAGSDADASTITLDEFMPDAKDIANSMEPGEEIPEELPRHQKKSLMTMLTNFWAERSASNWTPLEYPINATDHIFFDSDVIVREDEPSSLLAFALNSDDYKTKLAEIRQRWEMSNQRETDESSDGLEMKPQQSSGLSKAELENSLLRSTGTHLKYQFTEGSAKMMCKIFFAEQFDALRRKVGAADRFAESMSRCLKWDSKGGKTKSVFLKTLDDRFVLKSLSAVETSSFLKLAPDYFDLMAHALFHDLPSVIAKMLGFFQIIIRNPVTNTEIKLDLLVMENLFYDRSPTRTFDLKGSMRNRRIQSTGEQNEVLLDENMVEYIYESPLFAREHSKRLLKTSVFNDTLFLARMGVMDYSLMVAVDEVKKELVVGIIDCIRTYTWDKQLESWIKNRGFAGGGRNRPTVTSPKEYKSRFREAMARYILQAPNCWHTFGNHLPPNTPATPRTRFEGDV